MSDKGYAAEPASAADLTVRRVKEDEHADDLPER